jgi:hypothetical protein
MTRTPAWEATECHPIKEIQGSAWDPAGTCRFYHLPFVFVRMQRRHPRRMGFCLGHVREIFVAVETNRNADPGPGRIVPRRMVRRTGAGLYDPQHAAPAPYAHALAQRDFRRHAQREFDFAALCQRCIGKQKNAPGTEVLSKTRPLDLAAVLTQRNGQKICEPLSNTTFNPNWRSGHQRPHLYGVAARTRYSSASWPARKA